MKCRMSVESAVIVIGNGHSFLKKIEKSKIYRDNGLKEAARGVNGLGKPSNLVSEIKRPG